MNPEALMITSRPTESIEWEKQRIGLANNGKVEEIDFGFVPLTNRKITERKLRTLLSSPQPR
jgi:hypothetical protein